ncbi:hypothetical protein D3C87_1716540 [compost metagenome]
MVMPVTGNQQLVVIAVARTGPGAKVVVSGGLVGKPERTDPKRSHPIVFGTIGPAEIGIADARGTVAIYVGNAPQHVDAAGKCRPVRVEAASGFVVDGREVCKGRRNHFLSNE